MKAAVYRRSRGLVVEQVPVPDVGEDGVLVAVANVGFCGSDHTMLEGEGLPDGIILGHEVSGTVAQKGAAAGGLGLDSRVIVRPTFCGGCRDCLAGRPYFCQVHRRLIGMGDLPGGFAEYIHVFPEMLIPVPEGLDSRSAALTELFAAALHGLRCSKSQGGSALVMGAGAVGLSLVQLLSLHGFGPMVVSEPVASKRELARVFGADSAVDPFTDDLAARGFECTEGVGFDTVFECSGAPGSVQTAMDLAARGGTVCVVSVIGRSETITPITLTFKELWLTASYSNTREENIQCLDWLAEGKLRAQPLITDLITLDELRTAYEERVCTGQATRVVLRIGEEF